MWRKALALLFLSMLLALTLSLGTSAQQRTGAWFDTAIFSEEPQAAAATTRLEVGQFDLFAFGVSDPEIFQRVQNSRLLDYEQAFGSYTELTFNVAGPVLANGKLNPFAVPRIREAMNWLIDREYIAQEIYGGMAVPRFFPINNASADYARMADVARRLELKYAPDPARAEAVISEEMQALGATKVNGKWHYQGEPVVLILLIRIEDERRAIGDYVGNLLEGIGFTVDRQYKSNAEASPIWIGGDPTQGQFHIYTGGWITTAVDRDQGDNFDFFFNPRGLPYPLWQLYKPTPEFDEISLRLLQNDFRTLEERKELFARGLELALEDSSRIFLADRFAIYPRRSEISVSADLAGGVAGTFLWAHTLRRANQVGGTINVGLPSMLPEPWNPLGGSNTVYDQMLIRGTSDVGVITDPYTGLALPQRVERAAVYVKEGLPVGKTLDWLDLHFAEEITVPADAWVDWDAKEQRFITAAEKFPDGLTANVKSVVYYPRELFDMGWHDGSKYSVADFVLNMILSFDRGKEESPNFDQSAKSLVDAFLGYFRGVRIVSTYPLIIETYSDQYFLDAEDNVATWFPNYSFGPGPWHTLGLGLKVEAAGEGAFTSAKANQNQVERLNYIAGPSLNVLYRHLNDAAQTGYIPYAPTLSQYITPEEAAARWDNLARWYRAKGHFWVGSGPLYIEKAFPVEKIVHMRRFEEYPDPSDKWARFQKPRLAEVDVSGPVRVRSGEAATFNVAVTFNGEPYPVADVEEVKYLLFDATGELVHVGEAVAAGDGEWRVNLTPEQTRGLSVGSNRLEIVVSPLIVALPAFDSFEFISTP